MVGLYKNKLQVCFYIHSSFFIYQILSQTSNFKFIKNNKNISTNISNIENKTSIGERSLAISYNNLAKGVNSEVYIDTFFPEELTKLKGYAKDYFFHYNFNWQQR